MSPTLEYLRASDFLPYLSGKIALLKSDFNVPIGSDGKTIEDTFRITQAAPFIRKLVGAGVVPLIATHLGRPKGYDPKYSLDVLVEPLSEAIGRQVEIIRFDPATGNYDPNELNRNRIMDLVRAGVAPIFDNTRFHPDETKNGINLPKSLAEIVDVSIQDAFSVGHRKEATSNHIHQFVPGFAGDLFVEEIEGHRAIKNPSSNYVVIAGGDKAEDTLNLLRGILRAEITTHRSNLFNPELNLQISERLVNYVLIGGHLMHAFVYAQLQMISDTDLGALSPKLRKDYRGLRNVNLREHNPTQKEVTLARGLLRLYNGYQYADIANGKPIANGKRSLVVPVDYMVLRDGVAEYSVRIDQLFDGDIIVDIGAKTRELYSQIIGGATTIVWNGPMGVDDNKYADGTRTIIDAIGLNKSAIRSVGGGSTMSMISAYEREKMALDPNSKLEVGHRSTGGGATLKEIAEDSPALISLMMSYRRLLEGGYGPKFEYLRTPAIKMMQQR